MRRFPLLPLSSLVITLAGCAPATFRQVSFAGESAPIPTDSAGRTVHVVRNAEMKDSVLEARIRAHLEDFLLQRGFVVARPEAAELYFLATFGWGPRVIGSTAPVHRPAEVRTTRDREGRVTGRTFTPERMDYIRVPQLENSVWLMLLSSDAKHYRETGEVRNLWRGEAAMRAKPDAVAEAIPYLMVPALKYFGKGTQQTLLIDVYDREKVWQ